MASIAPNGDTGGSDRQPIVGPTRSWAVIEVWRDPKIRNDIPNGRRNTAITALATLAARRHTHLHSHLQWPVLKCSLVAAFDCSVTHQSLTGQDFLPRLQVRLTPATPELARQFICHPHREVPEPKLEPVRKRQKLGEIVDVGSLRPCHCDKWHGWRGWGASRRSSNLGRRHRSDQRPTLQTETQPGIRLSGTGLTNVSPGRPHVTHPFGTRRYAESECRTRFPCLACLAGPAMGRRAGRKRYRC